MIIYRSFIPNPRKDDGETHIGFFSSEQGAREASNKECAIDPFIIEPVEVFESVDDFYRNKKREIAKKALSGFSPEVQEAVVAYIVESVSQKS